LPSFFYVDSRSLTRSGFNFETSDDVARDFLTTTSFEPASPVSWEGITLYRGSVGEPNATAKLYTALNDIFGGTEFRLISEVAGPTGVVALQPLLAAEPKKIAVACGEPCSCSLRHAPESGEGGAAARPLSAGGWHLCAIDSASSADEIAVSLRSGATLTIAEAVFPGWASVPRN
jgi:hypothetical protein